MTLINKTFLPIINSKNQNWFIIDCKEQKLGRLSTLIVNLLRGKIKSYYFSSINNKNYIILINANLIKINKKNKYYFVNKPGKPGHSLKIKKFIDCKIESIILQSIKGMLSSVEKKNFIKKLKIYTNEIHLHKSQLPIKYQKIKNDLKL